MQEQLICSKCKFENFCEKSAKVEVVPSEHHTKMHCGTKYRIKIIESRAKWFGTPVDIFVDND